jgi:hypothetical protein
MKYLNINFMYRQILRSLLNIMFESMWKLSWRKWEECSGLAGSEMEKNRKKALDCAGLPNGNILDLQYIKEVQGLNPGKDIGYLDSGLSWFSLVSTANTKIIYRFYHSLCWDLFTELLLSNNLSKYATTASWSIQARHNGQFPGRY